MLNYVCLWVFNCYLIHSISRTKNITKRKQNSNKNMNKLSFKRTCSFGCRIMASTSVGIPELSAQACITIIWNWVQSISYKSRKVLTLWASKYGGNNFLLILHVYIRNGSNASYCFFLSSKMGSFSYYMLGWIPSKQFMDKSYVIILCISMFEIFSTY